MPFPDNRGSHPLFDQAQGISADRLYLAGEDLPSYSLLTTVSGISERFKLVRARSPDLLPVVAINIEPASQGQPIIPREIGMIEFPSGTLPFELIPGNSIYAATTYGNLTQTRPAVAQQVGIAVHSGIIWFDPDLAIDVSYASFITSGLEQALPNSFQLAPGPNIQFGIKGDQLIISGIPVSAGASLCTDIPKIDSGIGSAGVSSFASPCDHVHPETGASYITVNNENDKLAQSRSLQEDGVLYYPNISIRDQPPDQDASIEGSISLSSYLTLFSGSVWNAWEWGAGIFKFNDHPAGRSGPGINIQVQNPSVRDVPGGEEGVLAITISGVPLGDHIPLTDSGLGLPGISPFSARDDHVHPASSPDHTHHINQSVTPTPDGLLSGFTVPDDIFTASSLEVFVDGMYQAVGSGYDFIETNPSTGVFEFQPWSIPSAGEIIRVNYQT
jgi:hypothetical protein